MLNRVIFLLLFMGVLVSTIMALETPDLSRFSMTHNGIERTFFVHFPLTQKLTKPKPLVFVLHGGGGADAHEMAKRTGMNRIADREDFVVVYPYGVDGQWNDGRGKTFRRAKDNTNVDDVGFIASVITPVGGQSIPPILKTNTVATYFSSKTKKRQGQGCVLTTTPGLSFNISI